MITLPTWVFGTLIAAAAAAVLLAVLLWSARSQRPARIAPGEISGVDAALRAIEGLTRSWVVPGNRAEILENGDGFFPRLLASFDSAEQSIHLQVFAWWRGDICERVTERLEAAADRGVEVRLMVDALGGRSMSSHLRERLLAGGVRFHRFHDFRFRSLGRLNKRDHRKLAIIDGRVGFVFGHGIAKEWEGAGDAPGSWSDLGLRVEGPVVTRMQSVFAQHWIEGTAEPIVDPAYFPDIEPVGELPMHVVASSPRCGVSESSLLYRLMIAAAREELLIQNPYFAPGLPVVGLLTAAAERGVRVRIMVPGPVTDSLLVQHAGRHVYERLLAAGVEILRFQPTLNHQKVLIVDGEWSYVGSANFDERSFDINAEVGIGTHHRGFTERLRELFLRDAKVCERLEAERWSRRPLLQRLADRLAFSINEQL